jgi:putative N-acetyltransferase (TIGR04045 family)
MAAPTYRSSPTASRPAAARPAAARPAAATLTCRAVTTRAERDAHFQVRRQVFVAEQGLFRGINGINGTSGINDDWDDTDRDGHDDDPATIHVVGLADDQICGTVRLYPLEADGMWKGDRLAVLASHRHLGLGAPLVRFAVSSAGRLGGREMEAFIQPANVAFFRWLGWRRTGDLVDYAGIPHQRMLIDLIGRQAQKGPTRPGRGWP